MQDRERFHTAMAALAVNARIEMEDAQALESEQDERDLPVPRFEHGDACEPEAAT